MSKERDATPENLDPEPLHGWFELSYAQYLTIPRSVLQSMPAEWQRRFVACLIELDNTMDWRPSRGCYWVRLKDGAGRFVHDPLMEYERGRRRIPRKAAQVPTPLDCPTCPECKTPIGTPAVADCGVEPGRWNGPENATLFCAACGAGWVGTPAEVEQAWKAWRAYEATLKDIYGAG